LKKIAMKTPLVCGLHRQARTVDACADDSGERRRRENLEGNKDTEAANVTLANKEMGTKLEERVGVNVCFTLLCSLDTKAPKAACIARFLMYNSAPVKKVARGGSLSRTKMSQPPTILV